jgi:hypothetical protein
MLPCTPKSNPHPTPPTWPAFLIFFNCFNKKQTKKVKKGNGRINWKKKKTKFKKFTPLSLKIYSDSLSLSLLPALPLPGRSAVLHRIPSPPAGIFLSLVRTSPARNSLSLSLSFRHSLFPASRPSFFTGFPQLSRPPLSEWRLDFLIFFPFFFCLTQGTIFFFFFFLFFF